MINETVLCVKKEGGLDEIRAALDKAVLLSHATADVFAKMDQWEDTPTILILHLAIIKGSWTDARVIRSKHAGWTHLGEVAKPSRFIAERLMCEFVTPWRKITHPFVLEDWRACVRSGQIDFEVCAPKPQWSFVETRKHDITEKAEWDWEALAAEDGCVDFAHLQVLPLLSEDVLPDHYPLGS